MLGLEHTHDGTEQTLRCPRSRDHRHRKSCVTDKQSGISDLERKPW